MSGAIHKRKKSSDYEAWDYSKGLLSTKDVRGAGSEYVTFFFRLDICDQKRRMGIPIATANKAIQRMVNRGKP